MTKPETTFRQNVVLPFLKQLKNTAYFPIQQLAFVGDPDYLLCCNGTFVALELKREGEEPRPLQKYKLDLVRKAHGVSIVASPDNWKEVRDLLLKLDNREEVHGTD